MCLLKVKWLSNVRPKYFASGTPPKKILPGFLLSKSLTRTPRSLQGLLLTCEDFTKTLSKTECCL